MPSVSWSQTFRFKPSYLWHCGIFLVQLVKIWFLMFFHLLFLSGQCQCENPCGWFVNHMQPKDSQSVSMWMNYPSLIFLILMFSKSIISFLGIYFLKFQIIYLSFLILKIQVSIAYGVFILVEASLEKFFSSNRLE